MKKISEIRDHIFRPIIYLVFFIIVMIALFFTGNHLIAGSGEIAFADISKDDWSFEAAQAMAATGCMSGYESNGQQLFNPSQPMTRAEVAQVLYCLNQ